MKMSPEVFLQLRRHVPEAQYYPVVRNIDDYNEPTADILIAEVKYIQSLPKYVKVRQIEHLKYAYLAARLAFCGVWACRDLSERFGVKSLAELSRIPIPRIPGHKAYLWGDVLEWQEKWQ